MNIYKIEQYQDVGFGESIFIVGNGSSVISADLVKLPPDKTMTVNRAWKLIDAKFHAIIMHSGYIRDIAMMEKQPEALFIAGSSSEVESKYRKMLQNEVCFVPRRSPEWRKEVTPADFLDLSKGWYPTHTGLFAIQVAYFMGYKNIFLIGFDGYGCHFEHTAANPLDDHERHTRELAFLDEAIQKQNTDNVECQDQCEMLFHGPSIYNLNPSNSYNVFPKISLVDAVDMAKEDM